MGQSDTALFGGGGSRRLLRRDEARGATSRKNTLRRREATRCVQGRPGSDSLQSDQRASAASV